MALSDIINVVVTIQTARSLGAGFGIPLVVSHSAAWVERTRSYTTPAGVASDFAVTTPEYLAANAMFSQSPRPPTIKIGRAVNKPTQSWTVTPIYADSTVYTMTVVDTANVAHVVTFTSGIGSNLAAVITGLKAAIDALALAITTASASGNTVLTIVANVAGVFFGLSVADIGKLGVAMDHADVGSGMAAELTTIAAGDPAWYGLCTTFNSKLYIAAVAAWVESNQKLYVNASMDSAIATHALSGATDVAAALKTSAYARSPCLYHGANYEFADAAWLGAVLPLISGSETWAYKTLKGVTPEGTLCANFSATYRTNILAKNANLYELIGSVGITEWGTTPDGEYIDVIRFRDWLVADLSQRVFNALQLASKVPYTDPGVVIIQAAILASLKAGVAAGGLSADPKPSCTVPLVANQSSVDKAARNLTNVAFAATLAGAIHIVNPLSGVLTT